MVLQHHGVDSAASRNNMNKAPWHNLFKFGKGQSPPLRSVILFQVCQTLEDGSDIQGKKPFFSPQSCEERGPSEETLV